MLYWDGSTKYLQHLIHNHAFYLVLIYWAITTSLQPCFAYWITYWCHVALFPSINMTHILFEKKKHLLPQPNQTPFRIFLMSLHYFTVRDCIRHFPRPCTIVMSCKFIPFKLHCMEELPKTQTKMPNEEKEERMWSNKPHPFVETIFAVP